MNRPDEHAGTVARRTTAGFAVGSLGTGGFGVLPGLVLAYYLTDTLAVGALLAAVIVVIPKIVDVVINPLIGARSDHDVAATGARTRLMWIGSVAIVPTFILTFCAPTRVSPLVGAVWVLTFFTLAAVAYACFQVPYIALPTDLTPDYHGRTRLISARIVVLALAILVIGAGAPAVRDALGGGTGGYAAMAVAAVALIATGMAVSTAIAGSAARRAVGDTASHPETRNAFAAFRVFQQHRHYRILLCAYVIQALASAVMLAGAQYLATYVLDDPSALTPLFLALVAPALLVMPLWVRVGRRFGKLTGLRAASTVFLLADLLLAGAIAAPGPWVFGVVVLTGVGYAGMQTFPLAMLPDVIDEHTDRTGDDRGGALSGLWTAGETLGLAVGPGVYLVVLAATGFVSSSGDTVVDQPHSAIIGITAGFSMLPAALVAVSMLLLLRYDRKKTP
ncbi:MFS transporter [Gordonia hydrophobica]|uniref:MFS transporter n=1 Tax=Gordonia hydrophobica TaxID=40516 RepID=A0ABZ2U3N1_9ACTN|nr:MFS transporter [Gordonia hydrophobica]MBM7368547.1 Na+/melibiose symporter-like transporter [Gordonia hydrophobica]